MWKREDPPRPTSSSAVPSSPMSSSSRVPGGYGLERESIKPMKEDIANIGKSVVIKGELNGSEDLTIDGNVEGKIELREHVLTVGPHGRIKAQIFAKSVVVLGEVTGNITASEKVDIRENGSVDGDVVAPRVAIAEGAHFRGSVDMQRKSQAPAAAASTPEAKPTAAPSPPGLAPGALRTV